MDSLSLIIFLSKILVFVLLFIKGRPSVLTDPIKINDTTDFGDILATFMQTAPPILHPTKENLTIFNFLQNKSISEEKSSRDSIGLLYVEFPKPRRSNV